jgi:hypothetical protein
VRGSSCSQLQESLDAAERKITQQSQEMARLRDELGARAVKPDERILALQDEVAGLKLIAGERGAETRGIKGRS